MAPTTQPGTSESHPSDPTKPNPIPFHIKTPYPTFKPDHLHLDTNTGTPRPGEEGYNLRRTVKPTPWAQKAGIANCPIQQVPLLNCLYHGYGSTGFRELSHGLPAYPVLTNSAAEAIVVAAIRDQLWAQDIDIIEFSTKYWQGELDIKPPNDTKPEHVKSRSLTQFVQPIIDMLMHQPTLIAKSYYESQEDKIQRLQDQIETLKKADTQPTISLTPQKRPLQPESPLPAKKRPHTNQPPTPSRTFQPDSHRPLQNSAPKSNKSQDITNWIKKLKAEMPDDKAAKLEQYITDVQTAYYKMEKKDRPSIQDIAAQWGLPVSQASAYPDKALLKITATAAYQTATLTA